MSYGLLSTGFVAKPLSVIKDELEAEFKAAFGASINLDPESSIHGRLIGILSEREALLWDLALAVYSSQDPDKATGAALEALCALTGTIREGATKSKATVACVGTSGTALASGRVVSVSGSGGAKFSSAATATITAVAAWAANTAYVAGDRVKNGGNVYHCTVAGTSAASGGPAGTGTAITDNTVTWRFLGAGDGAVDVVFEAQSTGPTVATAGTLTVIDTPVSGWNAALNLEDAELGQNVESDAALRTRRANALAAGGNATLESIRTKLLDVTDVEACLVFENITDATDGDGLPPHSVEVLVKGGTDDAVRKAVFESVAAGIATHGSNSGTVTDSAGGTHTVKFSRPTDVNIYVIINVTKDAALFPSDGETQIKNALLAYGDGLKIGHDVVSSALKARAFNVAGVIDVPSCFIGTAPSPASEATVTITSRQLADLDSSRITVSLSNGSL